MKVFRLLAVLALCAPAAYAADEQCGSVGPFHLKHCPLGEAQLTYTLENTMVSSFTASGLDGVSIALPETTTHWRVKSSMQTIGDRVQFTESAFSNGFLTSRVVVTATREGTNIGALFTGTPASTLSALVYREGVLQASQGGIASGATAAWIPGLPIPYPLPDPPAWPPITAGPFGIEAENPLQRSTGQGACVWELPVPQSPNTARVVLFVLPNGKRVWGDKIRLVEEVPGAQSYPYTSFNGITITGTGIESLTLSDETIQ